MRWIGYVATILWWSGIARSLSTVNRGHSYKITPKPCRVPGPESREGTCMFVWECIKSEGTHVGVCVDTFMFGSCCVHNSTANSIAAPQHHHHHHQHHHHQHASSSSSSDPLRPTLAEALGNEATRPTLTSLSSFLVTDTSTARPSHRPSETPDSSGGSSRPHKPLAAGSARPLQKRPHAKPTSDHKDRIQTSAVPNSSSFWEKGSQSTKRPSASNAWDKGTQSTKIPAASNTWEKDTQSTKRPAAPNTWEKDTQSTKRPGASNTWEKDTQITKRPGASITWEKDIQSTKRPGAFNTWEKDTQSTKRPGASNTWEKNTQSTKRPVSDVSEKGTPSTKRPSTSNTWEKNTQSTRKPSTPNTWEKNTHSTRKPSTPNTWEKDTQSTRKPNTTNTWEKDAQSTKKPNTTNTWEKDTQSTRRPSTSNTWEKDTQSTRRPSTTNTWENNTQSTKKPGVSSAWEKDTESTKKPSTTSSIWEKDTQSTRIPVSPNGWENSTQSTKKPGASNTWEKDTQSTKRPGVSDTWEKGTQSTKRPGVSDHWDKNSQNTKRPSSPDVWEKGTQSTKRPIPQSTKRPLTTIFWENNVQNTKRPSHHDVQSPQQKTRPDDSQHTVVKEKETVHNDFQSHHQGFKDKVDTGHNTLAIRLPGKEHASSEDEGIRPNRPSNQRPFESRPDEGKTEDTDLSGQESVHRPNVNSVEENETAKEPHSNLNFIHTERPQWATKPVSPKPTTDFSKPYFSIKTTTYRPSSMNDQADSRPNFISKPNSSFTSMKTTTTARPIHSSGASTTSAAGSVPQTSHWQITTEPAFVTKQRPSSSTKPMSSLETAKPSSGSSHFWSENSWTPPRPSLKPHWTDNPSLLQNGPEGFPPRPSFKPTEPQENTEFHKPLGSAHYITTSHFETSARPRPTKKTTTSTTTTTTTTTTTSTTTTTTTPKPDTTVSTTEATAKTGSVLTVSAAAESKGMQCGVPPLFPRPETRIVGGKDAPFGRWPWQVSVRRTSFFGFSSTHRCGGAVLNENWIATAGHCVDDLLTSQIRIRVGEYDFSSVQERLPYVERGVAKKVVHPKYNFFTYEYDLALVRLESSLTFAPHISPICLPATDDLLIGENATVTGWGRLSEGGTLPSVLQEVSVPIVSNDRCKSMFLRAGRHEFIPEIFLCAGYETGGQDSCQGDSGGPLQVRGKDGRYFLAGIISWGIGCAEANLPGVCTRISKFVPWILKNVT